MGIYMIINKINNKIYIGQARNIKERWKNHINDLKNNKHYNRHLQGAWNKYGKDSFEFIIICECEEKDLDELEQYYIFSLDATNSMIGYNKAWGGKANKPTEETKQLLSEINKGEKHPKSKAIYCIELNRKFDYVRQIEEELQISHTDITRCCQGKRNTAGGYHWMFYEDFLKNGVVIREKKRQPKRKHETKVYCIELDKTFDSIHEADRQTSCDYRAIYACCNGKQKTTKGYHWKYVD